MSRNPFRLMPAALLTLAVASSARAAVPEAVLRGGWSEVRSRDVRVLSDAGAARARPGESDRGVEGSVDGPLSAAEL